MIATPAQLGSPLRLLLVDDEPSFHDLVRPYLREFQIDHAYNAPQAMKTLDAAGPFDVVLLDLGLPGANGFELLAAIRERHPTQPVIVVTGYANYELAHEAGKRGATLFCDKCLETYQRLGTLIARALAPPTPDAPVIASPSADDVVDLARLEISRSAPVIEQVELARRMARSVPGAIIAGEASVGKLELAQLIHRIAWVDQPVSIVNARGPSESALCEVLFDTDHGAGELARVRDGTLILRGVDTIPPRVQRRIAQACVSAGGPLLVATTRQSAADEVAAGTIAPELWELVCRLSLSLPPLQSRREDIADLLDAMTAHWASRLGAMRPSFHHGVLRFLVAYDWPGNLDQMSDLVARLVGYWSGRTIAIDQLPPDYFLPIAGFLLGDGPSLSDGDDSSLLRRAREHFERYFIRLIVSRHHGDKREAARTLGMSYRTLCDKLRPDPDAWASDV